jgi:curved DNA-binding protein CbpA
VRAAFRRLALELHPDQHVERGETEATEEGTTERFQRVLAAYETLRDPSRKERYDATGAV